MIKVIKNRIFLKKDEYPDKIGNIYIPKHIDKDKVHSPPYTGVITAVGTSIEDPDIVIGARIMFYDLSGSMFNVDGTDVLCINEHDVLGIILDKNLNIM